MVAVDLTPSLRYANASQANFSAIHMDGEPVEMVDATGFIATKTKFHGAQMASWHVQGASFNEADQLRHAHGVDYDGMSYEGLYELASKAVMSAQNARFENAHAGRVQPLRRRLHGRDVLVDQVHRRVHLQRANFSNAMFDQTDFPEASLSGSNMSDIRIDQCSFEDRTSRAAVAQRHDSQHVLQGSQHARRVLRPGACRRWYHRTTSTCNLTGAVLKKLVAHLQPCRRITWSSPTKTRTSMRTETPSTSVYDIVISENRYNDGLREKRD